MNVVERPWALNVRVFGRHQLAAALATFVDFSTMILLASVFGVRPSLATAASCVAGAVVNFLVARRWVFSTGRADAVDRQALRYALVSGGGALLNAAGLALVLRLVALPYVLGRAGIAVVVSVFYTYPLHARFVFRGHERVEDERVEVVTP